MHTLRAPTKRASYRRQSATQTKASSTQQSNLGAVQVTEPHQYTRPEEVGTCAGLVHERRQSARVFFYFGFRGLLRPRDRHSAWQWDAPTHILRLGSRRGVEGSFGRPKRFCLGVSRAVSDCQDLPPSRGMCGSASKPVAEQGDLETTFLGAVYCSRGLPVTVHTPKGHGLGPPCKGPASTHPSNIAR